MTLAWFLWALAGPVFWGFLKTNQRSIYVAMRIDDLERLAEPACRDFGVRRLDVFGSLARGEGSDRSDVDLLVAFQDPQTRAAKRLFGFLHRLEDVLDCPVDLLTVPGLRNPHVKKQVLDERILRYER